MDTGLNVKDIYPDTKVLTQYLGKSISTWNSFIDLLRVDYPLISTEWRYYNDGKRWLFKVTKKAKTVCWVSVWDKYFKVTFYFNSKANDVIKNSPLNKTIKERWLKNENNNIRPITIEVRKKTDLKIIKELIEIKWKIK